MAFLAVVTSSISKLVLLVPVETRRRDDVGCGGSVALTLAMISLVAVPAFTVDDVGLLLTLVISGVVGVGKPLVWVVVCSCPTALVTAVGPEEVGR